MVTVSKMTTVGTETLFEYLGKSGDEKPLSTNGSKFVEMDTGKEYFFDGDEKGWSVQADKYLDSIKIETAPTKTSYYVGDQFDGDGITIIAFYTDDSSNGVTDFVIDAPEKIEPGTKVYVRYTENGRTRSEEVSISIKSNEATDIESFIEIAQNGSEVVLDADVEIATSLSFSHDFILDLNGHVLSTDMSTQYMIKSDGAKLTITGDGEISAQKRIGEALNGGEIVIESGVFTSTNDLAFDAIGKNSKVTFNGGEIYAVEGGFLSLDGAIIEVNGGKIVLQDNFAIGTNGTKGRGKNTIIFNDGYLEGHIESEGYEAIGIYIANDDTFVMNGGQIKVENGAGICMRGGNVTINDGKISCTGFDGGGGWIGDKKTKMSQSAIIYDEKSNYPGKEGMSLTINGGVIVGYDQSIDIQSTEETPNVTINGGAFVPPIG